MAAAQRGVTELARLRRRVIEQLSAEGRSYAQIAETAGLSRGRIHQLRHRGPAPEGGFLGVGSVTIVTPLKQEAQNARPVVAVEDFATAQRLADLARTLQLDVEFDQVPLNGAIDLNRPNLIVICGPRLSDVVARVLAQDPAIQFERAADGPRPFATDGPAPSIAPGWTRNRQSRGTSPTWDGCRAPMGKGW